jgi:hypothetical protein
MSIFEGGLFDGSSLGDLGVVTSAPEPIANLDQWRATYGDRIPTVASLRAKGVTHFMATPIGMASPGAAPTGHTFSFSANQRPSGVQAFTIYIQTSAPVPATKPSTQASPAFAEGDGLLPASTDGSSGSPKWLPWALLGGGLLIAGGVVWSSSRKPVAANRRRRRRKTKR